MLRQVSKSQKLRKWDYNIKNKQSTNKPALINNYSIKTKTLHCFDLLTLLFSALVQNHEWNVQKSFFAKLQSI